MVYEVKPLDYYPSFAVRDIEEFIKHRPTTKWGWRVYRCTYDDDDAWERFKKTWERDSRCRLIEMRVPELADSMKVDYVEDAEEYDGISTKTLSEKHRKWTESLNLPPYDEASPYYDFCIYVDAEVLESIPLEVLDQPDELWIETRDLVFAKVLYTAWHTSTGTLESIYMKMGMKKTKTDYMLVPIYHLSTEMFGELVRSSEWHSIYQAPPKIYVMEGSYPVYPKSSRTRKKRKTTEEDSLISSGSAEAQSNTSGRKRSRRRVKADE